MSRSRSAIRFQLGVIVALASFAALGSFWLNMVIKKSAADSRTAAPRTEPDYHVENFRYVKMSKTGQPGYHVTGDKLTHYPHNDSFLITQPIFRSIDPAKPQQSVRSDTAIVEDDNTKVHMHNNVKAERPATPKAEAMQMTTEYLLVFPDDDIMKTDKPVIIHRGTSVMTGTGMFANNVTREIRILHNAKVVVQPKNAP